MFHLAREMWASHARKYPRGERHSLEVRLYESVSCIEKRTLYACLISRRSRHECRSPKRQSQDSENSDHSSHTGFLKKNLYGFSISGPFKKSVPIFPKQDAFPKKLRARAAIHATNCSRSAGL
jgi:hypothetical protein